MVMAPADQTQGLLAWVRTVQSGSFSAAARALGVAPSAVSKAVSRLERRLGVKLLQRTTRSLTLTQEGSVYYERVEPLLRALDEAGDLVRAAGMLTGTLRVSAPSELGRALASPLATDFMPRHPGLHLDFRATDRPVSLVREGVDVAIRVGAVEDGELNARLLTRLPLMLVASPAYLARRGRPTSVAELSGHAHVRYMLNGQAQPVVLEDGRRLALPPALDTDSGDVLRSAALAGLGLVQILASSVREDLRAQTLVPVMPGLPMPSVPVHALHAFGLHTPARVRLFIDFLVGYFEHTAP